MIAEKLMDVFHGKTKRLMIFMPPRHGKSELASVNFPAWCLGKRPDLEFIVASYSADLAQDFGYKTRNLVNSPEYQQIFETKLRDDSKSKAKWLTQEGGGNTAVGVGGAITGRGGNIILIDDPLKNREEAESKTIRDKVYNWYTSTAYTRLEKDGAIVLILTRWHDDDLAGRLIKLDGVGGDHWDVLELPAIAIKDEKYRKEGEALWKEKYTTEALENIKRNIGSYDWSALYQQKPILSEDQEFKPEYYQYRTWEEVLSLNTRNFLSVDTAISKQASADSTGFALNFVDSENKWNIRAWRRKVSPLELIDTLFTLWKKYNLEAIGIEETIYLQAIQPFLEEEMRKRNIFLTIIPLKHNQIAKDVRIRGLLPRYESHSIYHINGECNDLEEEQAAFPKGSHEDVLDAEAYQIQLAQKPEINEEGSDFNIISTDW